MQVSDIVKSYWTEREREEEMSELSTCLTIILTFSLGCYAIVIPLAALNG